MIEKCSFGSIVIEGKTYTSDLIIYPDKYVEDQWRRKSGHQLSEQDISKLIESEPEVIIAGTGIGGRMMPDRSLEILLREKGIEFIAVPNQTAMGLYNNLLSKKKIGACFHLTC